MPFNTIKNLGLAILTALLLGSVIVAIYFNNKTMSMLDTVIDDKAPVQEEIFTINRLLESATREFYAYIRTKKIYREDVIVPIQKLDSIFRATHPLYMKHDELPTYNRFTHSLLNIFQKLLDVNKFNDNKLIILELEQDFIQQLLELGNNITNNKRLGQKQKDRANNLLISIEVAFVRFLEKQEMDLKTVFQMLDNVELRLKTVIGQSKREEKQLNILLQELSYTRIVLTEYEELNESQMSAVLSLTEAEINVLNAWTQMRDFISVFNANMRQDIARDQSEISKASRRSNELLVMFGLVSLFLAALVSVVIGRTLTKRINRLVVGIRNLAEGDYEYRLDFKGTDELAFLANSFDSMVCQLKNKEQALYKQAHFDSLTGLPNRRKFHQYIELALNQAVRRNQLMVVMFIDLDNFKRVNDSLGHAVGDALLADISVRLTTCIRSSDLLGLYANHHEMDMFRLGGDEFVIVLQDLKTAMDAALIADRIRETLTIPTQLNGHEIHVSVSIGISTYPNDASDTDTLIKNADIAMYQAKNKGKNNYQFYSETTNEKVMHQIELECKLRKAIENDELQVYYQSQLDVSTNKIISLEALLRWNNKDCGLIPPTEFIPVAEDSNLIIPIGNWVIDNVCQQIKAWQVEGFNIKVAINLSSIQFNTPDFAQNLFSMVSHHGISSNAVILELTESMIMDNSDQNIQILHQLKKMGFELSIDDFGTGYSSLSYLKLFPLDELKIDRSFVDDIPYNQNDMAICSAIIAMASKLGLRVVAEGVEHHKQQEYLIESGCHMLQGYLYGKPVPASELDKSNFRKFPKLGAECLPQNNLYPIMVQ